MSKDLSTFQFTEDADNAISPQGWIVRQGLIVNARDGDDTIEGFGNDAAGILNFGKINTGDGNDRIVATGGEDESIYNMGVIDTGNGNDTIYSDSVENDGIILTGDGDDIITGEGVLDNDFGAVIDTGSGSDKIIFNLIWNDGLIATGSGNDVVSALGGGFYGDTEGSPSGEIKLGDGDDTLIGFGTGGFFGGTGTDKILFGEGTYKVSESTIFSDGRTMRVYEFEQIGGVNGGLFNYTKGTLTVDSAGIATFFTAPTDYSYSLSKLSTLTSSNSLTGSFEDFQFYNLGGNRHGIQKKGTDLIDEITGISTLTFNDTRISVLDGIAAVFNQVTGKETRDAQMFRLYNASFNRFPDSAGLNYWINEYSKGITDYKNIAESFIISNEFKQRYGATNTNSEFATNMYKNILGRLPDAEGLNYWVSNLNAGINSRADVLGGFSESVENITLFSQVTGFV